LENGEKFTFSIVSGALPDRVTRGSTGQVTVTILDDDGERYVHP